ncbi:MAG: LacI family DNA-binding transcriptional regulator [Anaerolineaceae bacterium]|jgi:DNA-binding LacI/PurR family transcriptional regulator|nr:LacI family DNA-binding transcriptional regulator [Anaerolineaceae bacterium]
MEKKVTIKDVAKIAGVSAQTVSRVVNNHPDVADETRTRIQKIVKDLEYSPNIIARSLIQGKTNTIGVVGFRLDYFGSNTILTAIERKAGKLGFSLLLTLINDLDESKIDPVLNQLLSRQVDGLIWTLPWLKDTQNRISEITKNLSVPVVLLNRKAFPGDIVVCLDNRHGARVATKHLLENGYKHVGIITGPTNWWEAEERYEGWREEMGFSISSRQAEMLTAHGDWTPQSGEDALYELIKKSPDTDAVFVSNDQMAIGVYRAAGKLGLRIPDDLGIVGFDNIPEAGFLSPPLTSIDQHSRYLGGGAVQQVVEQIKNPQKRNDEEIAPSWVKPELIIRESSTRNND